MDGTVHLISVTSIFIPADL